MEDTLLYSVLCSSFLILAIGIFIQTRKGHKNLPPSPPSLPIIGHLLLVLKQPTHRTLQTLSQIYGPVMSLRFGSRLVVVVSSPSAVEECFTKNDIIFANRPPIMSFKYIHYNFSTLVASSYGDHWRNLRRLSAIEIFSSTRLSAFADIRGDEVKILLRRIYHVCSSSHGFAKVEMRPLFTDLAFNLIMRMVAGKRYFGDDVSGIEEARQFTEIIDEIIKCTGTPSPGDFFPFLQCVDYNGFSKRLDRVSKKADSFLQGLIDEHRGDKDRNTMISHLLALQDSQPEYYTDQTIKGLILVLLMAGTESSSSSLEWAVSNLLNHPEVLKKAKAELDAKIGQDRLVEESDLSSLHYLRCIIRENLRLCPPAPILAPHLSSEDCNIGGYRVPAGTMLLVNAWAIQGDPQVWDDPNTFKPERFEDGKDEGHKMFPFGLGRRACPGEGLAHKVIGLALGSLIQCFECKRAGEQKIDMAENNGATMSKVEPLEVLYRAHPNLNKFIF